MCLSVCLSVNTITREPLEIIITKSSEHHLIVEREPKFENGCVGGGRLLILTVLFAIVITRPPLAGRSELVRSTCKSCRWSDGSSIYIGVQGGEKTFLMFSVYSYKYLPLYCSKTGSLFIHLFGVTRFVAAVDVGL